MKFKVLLTLSAMVMFSACALDSGTNSGGTQGDEESHETSGTSNAITSNTSYRSHNQGIDCLICHKSGEKSFRSGGTVYDSSATAAEGYVINLLLSNGQNVRYSSGRGSGNSHSSDYRLASSYSFTAQVVDGSGNVVNASMQNSHDYTRVGCNSCHTQNGSNGAPGRILNYASNAPTNTGTTTGTTTGGTSGGTSTGSTTTTTLSFANDVMPVLANCKACHGSSGRFSVTTASATYANINGFSGIDTANPTSSFLLQKASNSVNHGGGAILATTSSGYATIRDWIAQGAVNN